MLAIKILCERHGYSMEELKKHGKMPKIVRIEHGTSMDMPQKVTPHKCFKNPIGTAYLATFFKSGTGFPYALF